MNQNDQQLVQIIAQFLHHGTMSIVIVAFIQWLKASPWFPWINQEKGRLNAALGAFLGLIASLGVQYTVVGHVVTVTLDYVVVAHGLWHWIQQLALQHFVYHGFLKPEAPAAPAKSA